MVPITFTLTSFLADVATVFGEFWEIIVIAAAIGVGIVMVPRVIGWIKAAAGRSR